MFFTTTWIFELILNSVLGVSQCNLSCFVYVHRPGIKDNQHISTYSYIIFPIFSIFAFFSLMALKTHWLSHNDLVTTKEFVHGLETSGYWHVHYVWKVSPSTENYSLDLAFKDFFYMVKFHESKEIVQNFVEKNLRLIFPHVKWSLVLKKGPRKIDLAGLLGRYM